MKALMFALCCMLFFAGCATDAKVHYTPPIEKEVLPALKSAPPIKIKVVEIYEGITFTDVLKKEKIPTETFVPSSKKQVVIYKKEDHYFVYYFKRNKLVLKRDYSFSEWDKMMENGNYPSKIYKDLEI